MQSVRPKHFKRSGVVVLFAALCLIFGTTAASLAAGPPGKAHPARQARPSIPPYGMSWRDYHLMLAQQPLDAAATKIQALAARPGPAHAGFFETKVDAGKGILTVYWHGPIPATEQRLISRLRAHVDIQVVQTRYSLATLNGDVLAAMHADPSVVLGYPMTAGGGIVLGVHSPSPRRGASAAAALRSRLGVPVVTVASGGDHLKYCVPSPGDSLGPGSRCDDLAPFWGGDVIQSQYSECTGGFGAHDSAGNQYLITAAHCAWNGSGYADGVTFSNGQDLASQDSQQIGSITNVPGSIDWATIPTSAGDQIYVGSSISNGDTNDTRYVAGQLAVSAGDSLCESGAFGGTLCGFIVQKLNGMARDQHGHVWTNLDLTSSSGTGQYPVDGDSGGPWFSLDGCCTYVEARGLENGSVTENSLSGSTTYEAFTPLTTLFDLYVNTHGGGGV